MSIAFRQTEISQSSGGSWIALQLLAPRHMRRVGALLTAGVTQARTLRTQLTSRRCLESELGQLPPGLYRSGHDHARPRPEYAAISSPRGPDDEIWGPCTYEPTLACRVLTREPSWSNASISSYLMCICTIDILQHVSCYKSF